MFTKGVLIGSGVVVAGWAILGAIRPAGLPATVGWLPIFGAVMLTDAAYYCIHRWLNHGRSRGRIARWFRTNHVTHHLVPHLDFTRGNHSSLCDTAVTGFQLPLALIATVLGLDLASTLTAYGLVLMLQATHHVNHTFSLGVLRYFFMDNHAHKLHHCKGGRRINHAAMFSLWDRLGGTYYEDWDLNANYLAKAGLPLPR